MQVALTLDAEHSDRRTARRGRVLATGRDSIMLLHTWPSSVPAALPVIIRRRRDAGAEFVTLHDFKEMKIP